MKINNDVKRDFPILREVVYLDTSSSSPPPLPVISRIREYYERFPVNAGMQAAEGVYYGATCDLVDRVTEWATAARASVARILGAASPAEIVFTKNTSDAINVVATGFPFSAGEEIVVTDVDHQADIIPWVHAAKQKSLRVKVVQGSRDGVIDPRDVEAAVTERTALIAMVYISNIFGTIQPVEEVARIARRHGAAFFVDGAQACGRRPVDVRQIDCDFLSLCGRKALCGPQGVSVLYGRREALERLVPVSIGGRSARLLDLETLEYELAPVPYRFETGNNNNEGIIGLGAAIEYLESLGMEAIGERIGCLASYLYDRLAANPGLELYGRPDHLRQTGIFSFNVIGQEGSQVARRLWDLDRILVSPGTHGSPAAMKKLGIGGCLRASLHFFTDEADLDRLVRALEAVIAEAS